MGNNRHWRHHRPIHSHFHKCCINVLHNVVIQVEGLLVVFGLQTWMELPQIDLLNQPGQSGSFLCRTGTMTDITAHLRIEHL